MSVRSVEYFISSFDNGIRYATIFRMDDKDLYSGLIRLHILHHAVHEPVFGLALIEELARHGYRLSAGTLYPILHSLEQKGYLRSERKQSGGRVRRMYRATPTGRRALAGATERVRELFGELLEHRTLHHGADELGHAPPAASSRTPTARRGKAKR